MEDFYLGRSHLPAFGSWDYNGYDLPFTQCFETVANPEGLLGYSYFGGEEESDLYVAGDLYENDVVTPAMIVVPRRPKAKKRAPFPKVKEEKKGCGGGDCGYESYEVKEAGSHVLSTPSRIAAVVLPKVVDEDLYKISPDLLRPHYNNIKRKARASFFSSCLRPTCVC